MGRVSDILTKARDTLADPSGVRWTDARLLRLLDDGQKQINLTARLLRATVSFQLSPAVAVYDLPTDCYALLRISNKQDKQLPFVSHEEMDRRYGHNGLLASGEAWDTATGTDIETIIYNKLIPGTFRVYPIPTGTESSFDLENPDHAADPIFGLLVVASGYTTDSSYGLLADIDGVDADENAYVSEDPDLDPLYGITIAFDDNPQDLNIVYLKTPTAITSLSSELEISDIWDIALKHYVAGMALRDDKDTQNRSFASEELMLYNNNVRQAMKLSSTDYTATTHYNTSYIAGV
jgi:hypothetical protein